MRTIDVFVLAAVAAAGACNWTEFDNLADEAWVGATKKPDAVSSSDFGVAIARVAQGTSASSGGKLGILAAGAPGYSELAFDANGEASSVAAQRLQDQIVSVGAKPILISTPGADQVAAVMPATGVIAVLTGGGGALSPYQIGGPSTDPEAAAYVLAPDGMGMLPLVADGDTVYGVRAGTAPNPHPSCKLIDSATPGTALVIAAVGGVPAINGDDILVWATNGKLYKYPSSVFTSCTPTQAQTAALTIMQGATVFAPESGAQILTINGMMRDFVLLQGHNANGGILAVVNAATMTIVGTPVTVPGLRTAAILGANNKQYALAGSPAALIDGTAAGQVSVFEVSTTTGVANAAVATLHDAQPEANQSFGRGVAAMPFNGTQVIAVAADNEIFVYFRTNFYDETR